MVKLTNLLKEIKLKRGTIDSEFLKDKNYLADFLNDNYNEFKEEFGNPKTKFEPVNFGKLEDGYQLYGASAGIDEDDGIDISADSKFMELSDVYNDIEEVNFLGMTLYVNDYLNPYEIEDEDDDD